MSGCILLTTSGAGLRAGKGLAAYGMAKAGVINLPWNVAQEYGPQGIRANTALFLASDEASYVSGGVIPVDGGLSALYPTPPPDMD